MHEVTGEKADDEEGGRSKPEIDSLARSGNVARKVTFRLCARVLNTLTRCAKREIASGFPIIPDFHNMMFKSGGVALGVVI